MRTLLAALLAALPLAACNGSSSRTGSAASTPMVGTWTGTVTYEDASAPIQFVLTADGGALSGQQVLFDPVSGKGFGVGLVSGQGTATTASLTGLGGGITVTGTITGHAFKGTAVLPGRDGGTLTTAIALSQTSGGAK